MRAAVPYSPRDVRFEERDVPKIIKPADAVIRISATCVCGSDLWSYRGINPIPQPPRWTQVLRDRQYDEGKAQSIVSDERMIRDRNKVHACIENAKAVQKTVREHGSGPNYIDAFDASRSEAGLVRLKDDLQTRFRGLGPVPAYHILTSIGMPVLKPDRVIKRIFTRLGVMSENPTDFSFTEVGRKFAEATGHPIRYIDIVFVCYGQVVATEVGLDHGICGEKNPRCSVCGVTSHCTYYRRQALGLGGGSYHQSYRRSCRSGGAILPRRHVNQAKAST